MPLGAVSTAVQRVAEGGPDDRDIARRDGRR